MRFFSKKLFLPASVLFIIFTNNGYGQDFRLNDFALKFTEGTEIAIYYENGIVHFGVPSVDALNEQYQVTEAEKVFWDEQENSLARWYLLYFAENREDVLDIIANYQNDPAVEIAEPDYLGQPLDELIPNDTLFYIERHPTSYLNITVDQWGLKNDGDIGTLWLNGPAVPAVQNADMQSTFFWGAANPYYLQIYQKTIAILDDGLDWQHPDFYQAPGVNGDESNIWQNLGEDADGDRVVGDFGTPPEGDED